MYLGIICKRKKKKKKNFPNVRKLRLPILKCILSTGHLKVELVNCYTVLLQYKSRLLLLLSLLLNTSLIEKRNFHQKNQKNHHKSITNTCKKLSSPTPLRNQHSTKRVQSLAQLQHQ